MMGLSVGANSRRGSCGVCSHTQQDALRILFITSCKPFAKDSARVACGRARGAKYTKSSGSHSEVGLRFECLWVECARFDVVLRLVCRVLCCVLSFPRYTMYGAVREVAFLVRVREGGLLFGIDEAGLHKLLCNVYIGV